MSAQRRARGELLRGAATGPDLPAYADRALGDVADGRGEYAGDGGIWSLCGRRRNRAGWDHSRLGLELLEHQALLDLAAESKRRAVGEPDRDLDERAREACGLPLADHDAADRAVGQGHDMVAEDA